MSPATTMNSSDTAAKFEWTKDKTKLLICLLEANPVLWDATREDHKNRAKRNLVISNLASQLDTDVSELTRKMHNLRTQYNNELRKIKRRRICGAPPLSKWEFFDALSRFMRTMERPSAVIKTECDGDPEEDEEEAAAEEDNEDEEADDDKKEEEEEEELIMDQVRQEEEPQEPCRETHKLRRKPRRRRNTVAEMALEIVSNTQDDAQIFGNFVAAAIRNLNSDVYKRQLKRTIQQAILNAESLDDETRPITPAASTAYSTDNDNDDPLQYN